MLSVVFGCLYLHALIVGSHDIRVADVQLYHDSKYIPGYHLHTIGTYPVHTLRDCIYLCQNNDYCRTANYFQSNTDTMCTLLEENSYVGRTISIMSMTNIVISFNLCPNGFSEPIHVCFGLPSKVQPPSTVQNVMNNLRLVQKWPIRIYYPVIFPTLFYVPLFSSRTVQIFQWPSLKPLKNLTFSPLIYSFDMDLDGSFLITSTSYVLHFFNSNRNLTDASTDFYPAVLSDKYIAVLSNADENIYVRNSSTGQWLFNITIAGTDNRWGRIINEQLYVTSSTGLRRIDLSQGKSAVPITLIANLTCKEFFLDASGRFYIEKNDITKNNSFVYDMYGTLLANYTRGSKLIGKASKYTFYLLNNYENPLLFYQYP